MMIYFSSHAVFTCRRYAASQPLHGYLLHHDATLLATITRRLRRDNIECRCHAARDGRWLLALYFSTQIASVDTPVDMPVRLARNIALLQLARARRAARGAASSSGDARLSFSGTVTPAVAPASAICRRVCEERYTAVANADVARDSFAR